MPQSQRDVDEHDDVADQDGVDVAVALAVDLVLHAPLCAEGDGQVGVGEVLHEADEPETFRMAVCEPKPPSGGCSGRTEGSLFLPGQNFAHSDGVVQVVVEREGDDQSRGVVVVCVCGEEGSARSNISKGTNILQRNKTKMSSVKI